MQCGQVATQGRVPAKSETIIKLFRFVAIPESTVPHYNDASEYSSYLYVSVIAAKQEVGNNL